MAFKLANRVKMSVSGTPGTGSISLGSAISGYVSFDAGGITDGDTVSYIIEDTGNAWEIGVGTYTASGTVLARTSVTASSAGGTTKISATSAALVFIAPLAADLQSTDTLTSGTLAVARGGTGTNTVFTAGSLVFAGASGTYMQNNTRIFWDNTNFRLGIGTATPAVSIAVSATDAVLLPVGTTAQRPTGATGYLRFNSTLSAFEGHNGSAWGSVGGASGTNGNSVFYENDQAVTANYTLSTGKNAMSAGPIDVNSGVTVTIPSGSTWAIL